MSGRGGDGAFRAGGGDCGRAQKTRRGGGPDGGQVMGKPGARLSGGLSPPEYVEHLKDEAQVCAIIERVQRYLEEKGTTEEICRVYLRRILHTYYKFDYKAHQRQLTPPEGSSKVSLRGHVTGGGCLSGPKGESVPWEFSEAEQGGSLGGTGVRLAGVSPLVAEA